MDVDSVSPSNEKEIIKSIMTSSKMVYGDRFYVLNAKWWSLWKEYVRYDHETLSKNISSGGRPDRIDNEDLLETFDDLEPTESSSSQESTENIEKEAQSQSTQNKSENATKITPKKPNRSYDVVLKKGLSEGHNYVLLPESAWILLQSWYGGGPEICRSVIRCGLCGLSLQVDLFPLSLFVNSYALYDSFSLSGRPSNGMERDVQVSRQATFKDIRRNLAVLLNLAPHKMILKLYDNGKELDISTPENLSKTPEDLGMEDGQVVLVLSKSEPSRVTSMWPEFGGASSFRRETDIEGTPPSKGVVGLKNLGNTCFMNSVLQCLSNTRPLVEYFTVGAFLVELNTQNASGTKGNLANQFATLIDKMWSGKYTSVVPRDFKSAMANFAPQFHGYQQHDSQELLAFLLDGLHEDLLLASSLEKRTSKTKDSEPDPKLSADDAWLQYLSKNESLIVDLFQGQLKSTLVCDLCKQPNVTYDPFMFLSVPVPASKTRMIEVVFLPLGSRPIRLGTRVPLLGEARDLKAAVAHLASAAVSQPIPPQEIILTDIYNSRAFPIEDWKYLMDIRKSDVVFAYQVLPPQETEAVVEDVKHPFPEDYMEVDNRSNNNNVEAVGGDHGKTNDNNKNNHKLPVIRNIPLYQRRIIATHNNMHRTELFGFPYMLSFDSRTTTNADLYNMIKLRLDTFLSSTPNGSGLKSQPMVNIVNSSGKLCGLCKPSEQCAGCQLPSDETLTTLNPFSMALSLDWMVQDAAILFTEQNAKNFILPDKSLELTEEEKELLDVKLDDCIELFTKEEKLSAENKWFCPNCRTPNQATKKLDICKLPEVLIIHLKRFQYSGMYRDKLHQLVQFPTQLDFSQFLNKEAKEDSSYQLFAISNHTGGIESGHYIAYAKNEEMDKWYKFDDSYCTEIQEDSIVTNNAYILFYHRVSNQTEPRWKSRVDVETIASLKSTLNTESNSDQPSQPKDNAPNNIPTMNNNRPASPPAKRPAEDMEMIVHKGVDPSAMDVMHVGDHSDIRNLLKCPYCFTMVPCQEESDMEMHFLTDCSAYSAFLK